MYQQRLESLLAVDDAVGQIVNQLAAIGKLDQTYIIFTSDNGFFHGEHRMPQGKVLLYEPSIRVPLIIRGPNIPAGKHRSQFVENIDLAPTIVAATRRPARAGSWTAAQLLPFAQDPILHSGRDLLLETPTYAAIRTPNWLYAEHVTGEKELYNLARDRDQLNSLHNDFGLASVEDEPRIAARPAAGLLRRRRAAAGRRSRFARGCSAAASCRRTRVLFRVGGPSAGRVVQTSVLHRRASPQARPPPAVHRRGARSASPSRTARCIEALVTLTDSRRLTLGRTIRGCSL